MYVRAALLLAFFQQALGGGGGTLQLIKFRPDAITTEQLGYDDDHYRCGVNVTPDYIQGCVYTDCFTSKKYNVADDTWTNGPLKLQWVTNSDNDDTASWDVNAKRASRRRLGDNPTPFAYDGLDDYTKDEIPDCHVNPTAGASWGEDIPGEGNWSDCPAGNDKIPIDTLGDVAGNVGGKNVCAYAEPRPKTATDSNGNYPDGIIEYCLCKTVRCKVATMEDGSLGPDGKGQKYGQCNFNVRVETGHAVPYVPAYWMWIIFGFSLAVAAMTSGFFILMYGSAAHHGHGGGEGHGHKHGGEEKPATDE